MYILRCVELLVKVIAEVLTERLQDPGAIELGVELCIPYTGTVAGDGLTHDTRGVQQPDKVPGDASRRDGVQLTIC